MTNCNVGVIESAAVTERIWRHIKDTHHQRAIEFAQILWQAAWMQHGKLLSVN
jgi:hypothetical protein